MAVAVRTLNIPYRQARQMLVWEFNQRMEGINERQKEERLSMARIERAIMVGPVKDPPSVWDLAGVDRPPVDPDRYKASKDEIEQMKRNREKAMNNGH